MKGKVLFLTFLISTSNVAGAGEALTADQIRTRQHEYVDTVINTHRFEDLGRYYQDPLTYNGVSMSLAAYIKFMQSNVEVTPDLHWEIQSILVEGDAIAVRYVDSGTNARQYADIKPTGRPFRVNEIAMYHLRDGKFDEVWSAFDYEAWKNQTAGTGN